MASDDGFNEIFNFKWKIKNFTHCLPDECVKSPSFTVKLMDNTRWCLRLRPKKQPNGTHMEFYLGREADKNEPGPIRVAFELSFLDSYGLPLVKKTKEASFQKGEVKGFEEFLEQAVVYNYGINEYLPEDTLTACCRMRPVRGLHHKPILCSASTLVGVEQSSFYWHIKDFSRIRPGMLRITRKKKPYIRVELFLTAKPEEALQFEVSHGHVHKPNMTDCEISVINVFEETAFSRKDSKYLEGQVWKFPIFLRKSQLTDEKNVNLQNDTLVLKFDISVSLGATSSVIDGYRSSFLEDEISFSNENEDSLTSKRGIVLEIKREIDTVIKAIKEIERETSIKEVETFDKTVKEAKNVKEKKKKDINILRKSMRRARNVEEMKTKELETYKKTLREAADLERIKMKAIESLKKAINEMQIIKGTKVKETLKDSSTLVKDDSSPAQNEESYSTESEALGESDIMKLLLKPSLEDDIFSTGTGDGSSTENESVLEIKQDIDTLKKAIKELEKVEEMKIKEVEILEKSMKEAKNIKEMNRKESRRDSFSSVNESSSSAQNEEYYATDDDSVSEFYKKKHLTKTVSEDEASTSGENEDCLSTERKIMQEIDALEKSLKETEKAEEETLKEIETLKNSLKETEKAEEATIKEIEVLKKAQKALEKIKEIESLKKAMKKMKSNSTEN